MAYRRLTKGYLLPYYAATLRQGKAAQQQQSAAETMAIVERTADETKC